MNNSEEKTADIYNKYIVPNYGRFSLVPVKGEGSLLFDEHGNRYLDFTGGIAVNSLGHSNKTMVEVLTKQSSTLIHCSNLYQPRIQGDLAKVIVEEVVGSPGKCFFCNSGAEANEGIIKLSRRYGEMSPAPSGQPRREIICFKGSFHGRTTGGMAATGQEKIRSGFGPLMEGFKHVDFNDVSALQDAITEDTVAILLEAIQGEGGINVASIEFLLECQKICKEHNVLLLFDEVQCGVGRCGTLNGWQSIEGAEGIIPDAISWAKGMGGGFPIGAVWISSKKVRDFNLSDILAPGSHGSTFGGSPLASAVSYTVIRKIIDDNLCENVRNLNEFIMDSIEIDEIPLLSDIRGVGLMLGFVIDVEELEKLESFRISGQSPSIYIVNLLSKNGLLTVPAGADVIRWLPPLNVDKNEVKEAIKIMKVTLSDKII